MAVSKIGLFAGVSATAVFAGGAATGQDAFQVLLYGVIALLSALTTSWHVAKALTESNSPLRDLDIQPGACMAIVGAFTSVCLQQHHPLVAYAVKMHSNFDHRPLQRIMRTVMFAELAVNGSVHEQQQLASWLRWIHVRVKGVLPSDLVAQTGIKLDPNYAYEPEVMAYVLQTLAWSTTSFQKRYGYRTSERALDAMVLQYAVIGRQLGIPDSFMATTYADFQVSFSKRLGAIPCSQDSLRPERLRRFEEGDVYAASSWIMRCMFHCAWILGVRLLPEEVQSGYNFSCTRTRNGRLLYRVLDQMMRFIYPLTPWLPLRGLLSLVCVLEPRMTAICAETLCTVRSMDTYQGRPTYKAANRPDLVSKTDVDAFTEWIRAYRPFDPATGTAGYTMLQCACFHGIDSASASVSVLGLLRWTRLVARDAVNIFTLKLRIMWRTRQSSRMRRIIVFSLENPIPSHVGCIMDGNRRWSRQNDMHTVHEGHARGAGVARSILTWWIALVHFCEAHGTKSAPRVLTLWALSSQNMKRSEDEVTWLYDLLTSSITGFRYSPLVHLFKIRMRIIGSENTKAAFPPRLSNAIQDLHDATVTYGLDAGGFELQLALGYDGQEETVDAIKCLQSQGQDVTPETISQHTYTAINNLPVVELILRTSERRTSGFLLWEALGAELFFIDKLWPDFNEIDWLTAIRRYGQTEQRKGL